MDDNLYSLIIEHVIVKALDDLKSSPAGDIDDFKTENYDNEILVTVTILGSRRTISIPVISLVGPEVIESYLNGLVKELSPIVRSKIFALKAKLKGR